MNALTFCNLSVEIQSIEFENTNENCFCDGLDKTLNFDRWHNKANQRSMSVSTSFPGSLIFPPPGATAHLPLPYPNHSQLITSHRGSMLGQGRGKYAVAQILRLILLIIVEEKYKEKTKKKIKPASPFR